MLLSRRIQLPSKISWSDVCLFACHDPLPPLAWYSMRRSADYCARQEDKAFCSHKICQKCVCGRGSILDPLEELTTLPRRPSRRGGHTLPPHSTPLVAFCTLILTPSVFATWCQGPRPLPTPSEVNSWIKACPWCPTPKWNWCDLLRLTLIYSGFSGSDTAAPGAWFTKDLKMILGSS